MTATITPQVAETYDRDAAIKAIRTALKRRSGKTWSVTGGRGSTWGWIYIKSPPARAANQWGSMTDAECSELAELLGETVHHQGVRIPSSGAYRLEYVNRASGLPYVAAEPYWD